MALNSILFIMNYETNIKKYQLSSVDENRIREILSDDNIIVYRVLPNYYPLPQLKMQKYDFDVQKIVKQVFNEDYKKAYLKNKTTYTNKDETEFIEFYEAERKIKYQNEEGKFDIDNYKKEEAQKIAMKFANWIIDEEYELKPVTPQLDRDGYFIFNFYEVYKDYDIYSSYISVKVTEKGVTEAEIVRYKPIKFHGNKREIYPIDEVLINVLGYINEHIEGRPVIIDYIGIGYYIDKQTMGNVSIANPYYIIILNHAEGETQIIHVDAYTNEIIAQN